MKTRTGWLSLPFLLLSSPAWAQPPPRHKPAEVAKPVAVVHHLDLKTVKGARAVIKRDAKVQAITPATPAMPLEAGDYVIARWAEKDTETAPTVAKRKAWSVGYGFVGLSREGKEIRFRPVIETAGGLHVSTDARDFRGLVYVGLRDNQDASASYQLPQPISLLVGGQADVIKPTQLTIDHTNLPFTEVSIEAQDPPDALELSLQANGTTERASVSLPVLRPRLELSVARDRIDGLGLATTTIDIRAVGVSSPAGRTVTLTSDLGSVDPSQVRLDAQGIAVATMRSVSTGSASVKAVSPPLSLATTTVAFTWPFALLLATLLGGLAGAFLARLQKSGALRTKSIPVVALRGVLAGVIVLALYAVGVNVLPIHPVANVGEVLAFAVAAAGGFLGLKL